MQNAKRHAKIFNILAFTLFVTACTTYDECDPRNIDDAVITNRIRGAIMEDSSFTYSQIHVETNNNVVELTGVVDSARNEARLVELSQHVVGVLAVKDGLRVRWGN